MLDSARQRQIALRRLRAMTPQLVTSGSKGGDITSDTIKLLFTYGIAAIVIVGGGLMLYATRLDPKETDIAGLRLLLAGFIGAAITFVFNRESATQATRAAQSSSDQGAAISTPPPPLR